MGVAIVVEANAKSHCSSHHKYQNDLIEKVISDAGAASEKSCNNDKQVGNESDNGKSKRCVNKYFEV